MPINLKKYKCQGFYDELISSPGRARRAAHKLVSYLATLSDEELESRKSAAELAIHEMGISFTIYSDGNNIDRDWPFDIIPRIIPRGEWVKIEAGLVQRINAVNMFIQDLYNEQAIIRDGVVPEHIVDGSANFLEACRGVTPPHGVWANISGSDLVRDHRGKVYVLEDNLRVPSGVSYMIENRQVTKQVFPELFAEQSILPVDDYPLMLYEMLASLSPRKIASPEIVVLTPGIYNSAYFEHSFLAQAMGAELVEGGDLFVGEDDCVYMRTVDGPARVDVIYRRIDDTFIDTEVFREDSVLAIPGIIRSWRKGKVAIANAPGSGVADDKVVYAYMPRIIKYYLNEKPLIPNVPTRICSEPGDFEYVMEHIHELVVKPANESGGYGLLIGPQASQRQLDRYKKLIRKDPRNYIAQPVLKLSTAPILSGNDIEPRHLDLRPFILQGRKTTVTAGGLTRVALRKGSLIVNSSQGGGSKDTWIVED